MLYAADHPRRIAERVLPGLSERMAREADRVLHRRGVDVRMGTSVKEATADGVQLSDGSFVPTRSLVWCVGVRPDPLVPDLGLDLEKGRLVVDEHLTVPGHPEIYACGDAAAVPDLTRPGEVTPMTAQHAVRQGTDGRPQHRRLVRHRPAPRVPAPRPRLPGRRGAGWPPRRCRRGLAAGTSGVALSSGTAAGPSSPR